VAFTDPSGDAAPEPANDDSTSGDDVDAVLLASRALVAMAARTLAPIEEQLTASQWRALVVVAQRQGTALHEVASALGVHPSTATRTCDRLVAAGLICRNDDPDDRRYLALTATDEGRQLVESVYSARRQAIADTLERMPVASRRRLAATLQDFATAADEPGVASQWDLTVGRNNS
jgi:DNA-binding MarR family transcriptional regulator